MGDDDAFETAAKLMATALPFILAAAALLLGAFLGSRVEKIEILGMVLREKPFDTRGARVAAASAAVLCLIPAVVLAGVWPPPTPDPSPSPGPSTAVASSTPVATASASPSPTASPTVTPTVEPTATSTATPTTKPTANPVDKWARDRAAELASINEGLGAPSGSTTNLDDGWAVQGYEKGILYRNPDKKVMAIRGDIYERWRQYGVANVPAPALGYPTGDQGKDPKTGQPWQRFDTGAIECAPDGPCYSVFGSVFTAWRRHASELAYPTAEIASTLFKSSRGVFKGGTITVDVLNGTAVCATNGSEIETTGPITCGGASPPVIF